MKKTIIILAFILSAMIFTLQVTKLEANTIELKKIEFVTSDDEIVYQSYFEAGTNLNDLEVPDAPDKDGYAFIGWSIEIPDEMPNYSLRIVAEYIKTEDVVYNQIG